MDENKKHRILSGIQPSGVLHVGNYFGAIKQFLDLQRSGQDCYIFIANYHALTTLKNPEVLAEYTIDVARHYLAFGLDPDKVTLFPQSKVPEVCELSWYLSNVTPVGLLERCHAYKDKIAKGFAAESGLFTYPILMAADILMYSPDYVPVGMDQKQHVEVSRDIGIKFNNLYGDVLKIPDVMINKATATVPGTDGQKMSKSYNNIINPLIDEKILKKQVMGIVTDSTPLEAPKDPEKCNVFALYKLFANETDVETLRSRYTAGNFGFGEAKKILLSTILDYYKNERALYAELLNDKEQVITILNKGAVKAREEAMKLMDKVRKAIGII